MGKIETIRRMQKNRIIAIVRTNDTKKSIKIIEAIKDGGIDTIEITMTVPNAIDIIKQLTAKYNKDELLIGAGSVLDAETARHCILAGAEYIISPSLDKETIITCNRYQKVSIPGVMSITEVVKAMEYGADIIKIFPASLFGPKIVKAIKGPLPQAPLIPTGGINLNNIKEWIKADSFAVGVGSTLSKGAKNGDYKQITEKAKKFMKLIKEAKKEFAGVC